MTSVATTDAAPAERDARLTAAARRLRTRAGAGGLDRWLLGLGGLLLAAGVALILAGWYGVSHTALVFEQNSYLLSGGFLGLALVFAGGFVYFSYWITKLVREIRADRERMVRELRAQSAALAEAVARLDRM